MNKRKSNGTEIFRIEKQSWVDYWLEVSTAGPVMLVVGTFAEEEGRGLQSEKKEFANVRWMEIGEILRF